MPSQTTAVGLAKAESGGVIKRATDVMFSISYIGLRRGNAITRCCYEEAASVNMNVSVRRPQNTTADATVLCDDANVTWSRLGPFHRQSDQRQAGRKFRLGRADRSTALRGLTRPNPDCLGVGPDPSLVDADRPSGKSICN